MHTRKHLLITLGVLTSMFTAGSRVRGEATSRLSTSFLARGEQAILDVSVVGLEIGDYPEISKVTDIAIQPNGEPRSQLITGRRFQTVFQYVVTGYETGKYLIPPVEIMVDGESVRTEPVGFEIFNPDELQWSEATVSGATIRYASAFRTLNTSPFENETVPTEIKLYIPEDMVVEDWGIPEFERDGVTAWRFQPSPRISRINLLGNRYISIAYPSTVTPTRSGSAAIGPAKIRLTTREVVQDPTPRWVNREVYAQVPKLELSPLPLPEGAPTGFENAVGSFRLSSSTGTTDVQEGDPITVDLIVAGSGNLDILRPPKLSNADGWKIYGTTTEQRGEERRELSGSVVFHQSIRPLEMKSEIPPFRLVYFDPKDKAYKTLTTEPLALNMTPGSAPNPAAAITQSLPVPFERMTDILAILNPATLTVPASPALPGWLGHAVGGLLAAALVAKAFWLRYAPRFRKDPALEARRRDLREIGKIPAADHPGFLRAAGGFIERWLGDHPDPAIRSVLAERDAVCFRVDQPAVAPDRSRRDAILTLLRKTALPCLLLLALGADARADDLSARARAAYDSAKYEDALKLWLSAGDQGQLSADTLYNIGNACYRSGSAGQAALYYRRALVQDSGHGEARQNLRFLERKYGSITVQRPEFQYALAKFPLSAWKGIFWIGAWSCGLALLVFPATRTGARLRTAAVAALITGPLLVSAGLLGWRYFPDDAEFAPLEKQAVVVAEKVALHTDAARTAPEVIDAPPGSLCEIISESGRWAYVAFATKTRGWVPLESIEKVAPEKGPSAPKFRKPKADGKTA